MLRRYAAVLLTAFALCLPAQTIEGRWEGAARIPDWEIPLVVDLSQQGGGWIGSAILPGHGIKGAPLSSIHAQPSSLTFTVLNALGGLAFTGRIETDGTIRGEMKQAGNSAPFSLHRTGPPQVELPRQATALPKELEGEWKGEYELLGYSRKVTLKLSNSSDAKAKAELVIVGKRVNNIPVDLVYMDGNFLNVESKAAQITFELGFGKEQGELKGAFQQGPFEAPVTLRK